METSTDPSLGQVFMNTRAQVIDAVVATESMIAALQAHRATLLVDAARLSMTQVAVLADPTAWDARTIARKELESEVACALRIPERAAQSLLGEAAILIADLPVTLAALQAGRVSYRHVQTIIDHASELPEGAVAAFDASLVPFAERLTPAQFTTTARKYREKHHPQTITARRTKAVQDRWVSFDPAQDGMGYLTAYLPAEQGVAIYTAVTDAAMKQQGPTQTRTLAQLRADVFADQMLGGDALTGIVPTVMVTVPVTALTGTPVTETAPETAPGTTPATVTALAALEGYGPISPEAAQALLANAKTVTRLLTDPQTGQVISMSADTFTIGSDAARQRLLNTPDTPLKVNLERDSYTLPRRMRRYIQFRDGTCRHRGCGRRAVKTDIDHLDEWATGGKSNFDNLYCLCAFHHKLKTITRWKVKHLGNGILRWTSPDGKTYDTWPDNPIRPG